tara:strand:- start:1559 stop:2059 length:501 start_codon:yes stop_codon:yes gene_type:complete
MKTFRKTVKYLLTFSDLSKMNYQIGGSSIMADGSSVLSQKARPGCTYKISTLGERKIEDTEDLEDPAVITDITELNDRQLLFIIKEAFYDKIIRAARRFPRGMKLTKFVFSQELLEGWLSNDEDVYTQEADLFPLDFYENLLKYIPTFLNSSYITSNGCGGGGVGA